MTHVGGGGGVCVWFVLVVALVVGRSSLLVVSFVFSAVPLSPCGCCCFPLLVLLFGAAFLRLLRVVLPSLFFLT